MPLSGTSEPKSHCEAQEYRISTQTHLHPSTECDICKYTQKQHQEDVSRQVEGIACISSREAMSLFIVIRRHASLKLLLCKVLAEIITISLSIAHARKDASTAPDILSRRNKSFQTEASPFIFNQRGRQLTREVTS